MTTNMKSFHAIALVISLLGSHVTHADPWSLSVVDETGKPIQATVQLSGADESFTETRTDEHGFLPGDSVARNNREVGFVTIYAPGHAPAGGRLQVGNNKAILGPPYTLEGRVLDEEGHPLAGVNVSADQLYPAGNGYSGSLADSVLCSLYPHAGQTFTARTDAAGRYTLNDLPASGRAVVSVRDPAWELARITADLGAPGDTADLRTRPASRLTGRVVDGQGRPQGGVALSVNQGAAYFESSTDADGRYAVAGLPPGMASVSLSGPPQNANLVAPPMQVMTARGADTTAPDIVAGPGAEIEFDLAPPAGAGGSFEVAPDEPGQPLVYKPFAGSVTRLHVLPGHYHLMVLSAPSGYYPSAESAPKGIELNAVAGEPNRLTVALKPALTLTGTARDENGDAVPGVEIANQDTAAGVTTGADGGFTLADLRPGTLRLTCNNGWEIAGPPQISVPQPGPLDLRLRKAETSPLNGRVVTENGTPVAGAVVTVAWTAPNGDIPQFPRRLEVNTDADGRYQIRGVRTVAAPTLEVEKAGYRLERGGDIAIQRTMIGLDGQERPNPAAIFTASDLVLQPLSRRVTGRVVDSTGHGVPNALVAALGGGSAELNVTPRNLIRTDSEGRFILNGLPDGDLEFVAGAGAGFSSAHSVADELGDLVLKPQTPALPDAQLARQLISALIAETDQGYTGRYDLPHSLLPYDMTGALQTAKKVSGGDATYIASILVSGSKLLARGDRDSARRQIPELLPQIDASIADIGRPFVAVRAELSALLPPSASADSADDAALRNWLKRGYDKAATTLAALTIEASVDSETAGEFASMAVLARRLGDGAADGWAADALGIAARADADIRDHPDKYDEGWAGQPGGYWAAHVLAALAEAGPALAEKHIDAIASDHRYMALGAVIPIVASEDPAAGQRLLASMDTQAPPAPFNVNDKAAQEAHDAAVIAVIVVMPTARAQEALSMARSVRTNAALALAQAARLQPPGQALPLFREAFSLADYYNADFGQLQRIARLAATFDPALGAELQNSLYESCFDAAGWQRDPKFLVRALAAAPAMPGLVRAWLEWAWAQPPDTNWYYGNGGREVGIALAMAAIDTDRALDMARSLPHLVQPDDPARVRDAGLRWQAESKIAQYLAIPQNDRDNIDFDAWQGSSAMVQRAGPL